MVEMRKLLFAESIGHDQMLYLSPFSSLLFHRHAATIVRLEPFTFGIAQGRSMQQAIERKTMEK